MDGNDTVFIIPKGTGTSAFQQELSKLIRQGVIKRVSPSPHKQELKKDEKKPRPVKMEEEMVSRKMKKIARIQDHEQDEREVDIKTAIQTRIPNKKALSAIKSWCDLCLEKLSSLYDSYDLLENKDDYIKFKIEVIKDLENYKKLYGSYINKTIKKLNDYVTFLDYYKK